MSRAAFSPPIKSAAPFLIFRALTGRGILRKCAAHRVCRKHCEYFNPRVAANSVFGVSRVRLNISNIENTRAHCRAEYGRSSRTQPNATERNRTQLNAVANIANIESAENIEQPYFQTPIMPNFPMTPCFCRALRIMPQCCGFVPRQALPIDFSNF